MYENRIDGNRPIDETCNVLIELQRLSFISTDLINNGDLEGKTRNHSFFGDFIWIHVNIDRKQYCSQTTVARNAVDRKRQLIETQSIENDKQPKK